MKTIALSEKLRKQMEEVLSPSRFDHTLGVAYTAAALSFVHGAVTEEALTAGMLHDCAKCLSDEEMLKECQKAGLAISDIEREAPQLLHARLGAYYAKERYGVENEDVLNAIRSHTTGRPEMSLLEKIIFTADYIEPNRKPLEHLPMIRKEAFRDLDHAVYLILRDIRAYLQETAKVVDPMTEETYTYYKGAADQVLLTNVLPAESSRQTSHYTEDGTEILTRILTEQG